MTYWKFFVWRCDLGQQYCNKKVDEPTKRTSGYDEAGTKQDKQTDQTT